MNTVFKSLLIALFAVGLSACDNKINQENYEQLEVGMTQEQVQSILGEPDSVETGSLAGKSTWESRGSKIEINFLADRVTTKHFSKE